MRARGWLAPPPRLRLGASGVSSRDAGSPVRRVEAAGGQVRTLTGAAGAHTAQTGGGMDGFVLSGPPTGSG